MKLPLNPLDPLGLLDVSAGLLLWSTASPLPALLAQLHAGFLVFKGLGGMTRVNLLPMPVFVLGGAADLMSAAILFTGKPPLLVGYKGWIAGALFLKGVFTLLSFMQ
ncbi:MAG: hypothetical protein ABEJ91_04310 [Candidatus Nanohaloarchaea archaeon]